ncbi:N-acetyl-ornithine/N-acetyl-lysine deacetylase [Ignisphaera aggregans DSM 17230]|uniref:Putative [LysW]-lysine/[LysW]-ornithine hydrolase n=1 Tax=Ignisphaera aggregans (strain DSM 17230 / JCM 13409 / AQ1.S1) TaxID=583356 RepID=E0SS90_IGNAA|nr:N-acetyl-ornithine/N-acetyl-lysine deacetylase [Ignisphaera aggregans DSM 17230]
MLIDILKAYSPTNHEDRAIEVLKNYAYELGYEDIVVDEVGNLIASYGRGPISISFIGHIDTVPGELPVSFNGDVITGRGAVDAKGPLVAMFIGASLAKRFIDFNRFKVYAIAVTGEEGDSRGAKNLVKKGFRSDGAVIGEPSNNSIVVGYRGSIKMKIVCRGIGGHSSSPSIEATACDKVIDIWSRIRDRYRGYRASETSASLIYLRCGEESSSVHPRYGESIIDIRVSVDRSIRDIVDEISQLITISSCEYSILDYTNPVKVSLNNVMVRSMTRAMVKHNIRPRFTYKLGTSDMNIIYPIVTENIVAFGPGRSELSHSDREEISIDEMIKGIYIYRDTINEFINIYSAPR